MLCRLLAVIVLSFGTLSGAIAMGKKPPPTKDTTAPSIPQNLTAKNLQTNAVDIQLAWNASTDNTAVTGYHVDRDGAQIATTATPGYTDTKAAPHANVTYSVSAFDAAGNESVQSKTAMLFSGGPTSTGASEDKTFTPNAQYYMTTGGNDGNPGTFASPWASPNHAVNCGDVILAQPGAYGTFAAFGAVSNCPSTINGIDGAGGIQAAVLLCAGNVGTCTATGSGVTGFDVSVSHWAVEGWQATSGVQANVYGFFGDACSVGAAIAYIAFINDIAVNSGIGFGAGPCGNTVSIDQWATVGSITYNANQTLTSSNICTASIVDVVPGNQNAASGTHVYIAGNYAITNQNTCISDAQGIMLDTFDGQGYTGQTVIKDNIIINSSRYGIHVFDQNVTTSAPDMEIYHNTSYGNLALHETADDGSSVGELNFVTSGAFVWHYITNVYNNIAQSRWTTEAGAGGGAASVYGLVVGGPYPGLTIGGTGKQNILKGVSSQDQIAFNGGSTGTNTVLDPVFKNTADLIANHYGQPSCTSFVSTAACMGWNQSTKTVTSLSVIDDLTPTAGGAIGNGFQTVQTCAADTLYPIWLKGLVYLSASYTNGAVITEKAGLISKPCNM